MKQTILLFIILLIGTLLLPKPSYSQDLTQTIRGKVVDAETSFPLAGASVACLVGEREPVGQNTNKEGNFRIENIPVGRISVIVYYYGYRRLQLDNIEVTSAKEVILNIKLEPSVEQADTVSFYAQRNGQVRNELAVVSAREFSVEETNLYAGSRGEPARMATNFAGVQGGNDSQNDIVIRGNTPAGLLYRLEGINIPNPNHFAIPGTNSGPVTILNNKFLANSDFYTGAWPAEFGNALSGVFDLRMRNGNNQQHEFSGQLGLLGTELFAEGPINKEKGSSYLGMYRYSTVGLFRAFGINIGTNADISYQDGAFRLNFPLKNGAQLAFWGIGGLSSTQLVFSDEEVPNEDQDIYSTNQDRDQYFSSNTGVLAATYTHPINLNTYFKLGAGVSVQGNDTYHFQLYRTTDTVNNVFQYQDPAIRRILDYDFIETKLHAYAKFNRKINRKNTLNFGINLDFWHFYYLDSVRIVRPAAGDTLFKLSPWRLRWDGDEWAPLIQPYINYKWKPTDRFELVAGVSSTYFGLNSNSFSPIEPRLGLSYQLTNNQKLSFGLGLHSQIQAPYLYFYGTPPSASNPEINTYNKDMGLTKSAHAVLGYDFFPGKFMRVKAEVYYQYLYDIPIDPNNGAFSLINSGSGFSRFFPNDLVNEGTGRNYGLELTLERFFAGGYYFLLTGSIFDAKYRGSDDTLRNTTFNGRYTANGLVAKEWKFGKGSSLTLGGKVTYIGGRWRGQVDTTATIEQVEIQFFNEGFNSIQFAPYFRTDVRLSYRVNQPRITHEVGIDLINVFNTQNILTLTYIPRDDRPIEENIAEEYQLGFFPIFYYKIDF